MRWSNVALIFGREVRDQLRDRRTLFMIFVLPILLYPILGIGVLKFAATLEEKPRSVVVVGAENLPKAPGLLNAQGDGFNPELFDSPRTPTESWSRKSRARARGAIRSGGSARFARAGYPR